MLLILSILLSSSYVGYSDHFLGAAIDWRPVRAQNLTARFNFRIQYLYSHAFSPNCTKSRGDKLVSDLGPPGYWKCVKGCDSNNTAIPLFQTAVYCDAIDVRNDWEQGVNSVVVRFNQSTQWPVNIAFKGGFWRNLTDSVGKKLRAKQWIVQTIVDLRARNDTRIPNSSPSVLTRGRYSVAMTCAINIQIPVRDIDGDVVRCRFSNGTEECKEICQTTPNAVIHENCTLSINATSPFVQGGWYAIAITVEDFVKTPIELSDGTVVDTTTALSSAPSQFLLEILPNTTGCGGDPEFVDPTPLHNLVYKIQPGDTWTERVYAQSAVIAGENNNISDIVVQAPKGTTASDVKPDTRNDTYYIEVSFKPGVKQYDENHRFCFSAVDSRDKASSLRCVYMRVDQCALNPCKNSGTCFLRKQDYRCGCRDGFLGENCEVDIDECSSSPCQNNASCIDQPGHYLCYCPPGWTGKDCERRCPDGDCFPRSKYDISILGWMLLAIGFISGVIVTALAWYIRTKTSKSKKEKQTVVTPFEESEI